MARYSSLDDENETTKEPAKTVFTNEKPDLAAMARATDRGTLEILGEMLGLKPKDKDREE